MVGDGAHGIVGDAGGIGAADPGRVGEKRVEATVTALWNKRCQVESLEGSWAGVRQRGLTSSRSMYIPP